MKVQLLVTATGEDRPGIVARLTEVLVAHSANLEESRMALLGGEFAAIMLVSVPGSKLEAMVAGLEHLQKEAIRVTTKPTKHSNSEQLTNYLACELTVSGADHEGIVHRVTDFLRQKAINIESLESYVVNAPVSGTPLFNMRASLQVPPTCPLSDLRHGLQGIAESQTVDIEVNTVSEPVAH